MKRSPRHAQTTPARGARSGSFEIARSLGRACRHGRGDAAVWTRLVRKTVDWFTIQNRTSAGPSLSSTAKASEVHLGIPLTCPVSCHFRAPGGLARRLLLDEHFLIEWPICGHNHRTCPHSGHMTRVGVWQWHAWQREGRAPERRGGEICPLTTLRGWRPWLGRGSRAWPA